MEPGFWADLHGFPLVYLRNVAPLRAAHVDDMTYLFERIFQRREEFVIITDVRGADPMRIDVEFRRAVGDFMQRFRDEGKRYTMLGVLVSDSMLTRAFLRGVQAVVRDPNPTHPVSSMADALDLVEKAYRLRRREMPPRLAAKMRDLRAEKPALERVVRGQPLQFAY
jgi:hypothetical protein